MRHALLVMLLAGCKTTADDGDDDTTDTDTDDTTDTDTDAWRELSIPLEGWFDELSLDGDTGLSTTYLPLDLPELPALDGLTVDLEATLGSVTISGDGPGEITTWIRVGPLADGEAICTEGTCLGVVTVTRDGTGGADVEPPELAMSIAVIELITGGELGVCFGVRTDVEGSLSATALEVSYDLAEPCTEPPSDVSGAWTSTFTCEDSCLGGYGGELTLTVVQDGATATYTDSEGGSYSGTVCGDVFTYTGGGAGWNESGRLVLGAGGATKTSRYDSPDCCVGACEDVLTRP